MIQHHVVGQKGQKHCRRHRGLHRAFVTQAAIAHLQSILGCRSPVWVMVELRYVKEQTNYTSSVPTQRGGGSGPSPCALLSFLAS